MDQGLKLAIDLDKVFKTKVRKTLEAGWSTFVSRLLVTAFRSPKDKTTLRTVVMQHFRLLSSWSSRGKQPAALDKRRGMALAFRLAGQWPESGCLQHQSDLLSPGQKHELAIQTPLIKSIPLAVGSGSSSLRARSGVPWRLGLKLPTYEVL